MVEMKTNALMDSIEHRIRNYLVLPWLNDYTDNGSFRTDESPEGAISFQEIGKWLIITVVYRGEGTTMDQSTNRLSGDPYYCVVRYDWIGLSETAPNEVEPIEELSEWAIQSLMYVRENTDIVAWGVNEGSYIEDFKADGTLVIREQNGRYQDANLASTGDLRKIHL